MPDISTFSTDVTQQLTTFDLSNGLGSVAEASIIVPFLLQKQIVNVMTIRTPKDKVMTCNLSVEGV